jgi:hypothetical protein
MFVEVMCGVVKIGERFGGSNLLPQLLLTRKLIFYSDT